MKSDAVTETPVCNTGGILPTPPPPNPPTLTPAQGFIATDWFRATLQQPRFDPYLPAKYEPGENGRNPVNDIIFLYQSYAENYAHLKNSKGYFNYDHRADLFDRENDRIVTICYGGNSSSVLVEASGRMSIQCREITNEFWISTCTRRDISLDWESKISIWEIRDQAEEITKKKCAIIDKHKGVTLEIGDRKHSEYFFRIYEKGKEQGNMDSSLMRLEAEIKPEKREKARRQWLSTASDLECIQANHLASVLFSHFAETNFGRLKAPRTKKEIRVQDMETLIRNIHKQYGQKLIVALGLHGGDEAKLMRRLIHGK